MRLWAAGISACLALVGCGVEPDSPCAEEGPEGSVCREHRFLNGSSIGHIEHSYLGDTLVVMRYINPSGDEVMTVTERYREGLLQVSIRRPANGNHRTTTYHYNSSDSLEQVVFGTADSIHLISYEHGHRTKLEVTVGLHRVRWEQFRYYEDDGRIYRISQFDGSDNLLRYRIFRHFDNGFTRIDHLSGAHQPEGHGTWQRRPDGKPDTERFTDQDGTLLMETRYVYNGHGQLIETHRTDHGEKRKSIFIYH